MSKTRELYAPSDCDGQNPQEHNCEPWSVSAAITVDSEHNQGRWSDWQRGLLMECIDPASPISNRELYLAVRNEIQIAAPSDYCLSLRLIEAWEDFEAHMLQQEEQQYSQPVNEKPRG